MFASKKRKEKSRQNQSQKISEMNEKKGEKIFDKLDENIEMMNRLFQNVDIMISRRFQNPKHRKLDFCLFYSDGVVDSALMNESIIKPILLSENLTPGQDLADAIQANCIFVNEVTPTDDVTEIIEAVTYGDSVLFMENSGKALIINNKCFNLRSISEPETEKVISGSREGFTEGIMTNLSLIRRRMRTHHLKVSFRTIGRQTATKICVCYMDNIVNKNILEEVNRRLDTIDIDGILDSNYITELISERSIFHLPTSGSTERPDIVVSKLLEGRIAIFVDGSPMVLTVPYLFIEPFQSNEDYYVNSFYGSFSRILRISAFLVTIITPALYIAIVAFHHEILPERFMINIMRERMNVPLPASVECAIMLVCFDVLREAGVRMPNQTGQALSIVGALVIGQSAVEAELVASPMIIVVALTGITGLIIPKLTAPTIFCRYFFLLMGSAFGLFGLLIAASVFLTHLLGLKSYKVSYVLSPNQFNPQQLKDTFIRAPWPYMLERYLPFTQNLTRSRTSKPHQ